MARRKKPAFIKRILVIGVSLIALQVGLVFYFQQNTQPIDIRQAINKKIDAQTSLPAQRREQMKIQLAVGDFRMTNGKFPANLNELVPKYFDRIPIDPDTDKPFEYSVEGDRFFVGDRSPTRLASARTGETGGTTDEQSEQNALIASLDEPLEKVSYVYDATNKRDPFRPFSVKIVQNMGDCEAEPLTCWDIGQLKLTIVISDAAEMKANVEDSTHRGYIVKKGTKIGRNNGEVVEVFPDRLKILETNVDFTGETKTNVVEMLLRSKDLPAGGGARGDGSGVSRKSRQ
jgi:Tfp pilus assembly protein PilP